MNERMLVPRIKKKSWSLSEADRGTFSLGRLGDHEASNTLANVRTPIEIFIQFTGRWWEECP